MITQNKWSNRKTFRLTDLQVSEISKVMDERAIKTENEALGYILNTYRGMVHQIKVLTSGLNDAEAEIEEYQNIKTRFREVLMDLGIVPMPVDWKRDEEE